MVAYARQLSGNPQMAMPGDLEAITAKVGRAGGTPLAVTKDSRVLGVIYLKDIIKTASASVSPNCAGWAFARS